MIGVAKTCLNGGCRAHKWNIPHKPAMTRPWILDLLPPPLPSLIFLCITFLPLCWIKIGSLRQGIYPIPYFDSMKYETRLQIQNHHFRFTALHVWTCLRISLLSHLPSNSFHFLCFSMSSLCNSSFRAAAPMLLVFAQARKQPVKYRGSCRSGPNKINVNIIISGFLKNLLCSLYSLHNSSSSLKTCGAGMWLGMRRGETEERGREEETEWPSDTVRSKMKTDSLSKYK